MGLAEVEGFEGVGRGLTDLIRLWKCAEKPKPAPFEKPTSKGMRHPRSSSYFKGAPPARSASNCFNGPIISASLCFPFDIALLLVPQNHIHFPAVCGEQVTPDVKTTSGAPAFFHSFLSPVSPGFYQDLVSRNCPIIDFS